MIIYCCGCQRAIDARLTDGREIYPRRPDLASLPFWRCDGCGNQVGCHHKTKNRTKPLGNIATPEIKGARQHIHRILDPLWKSRTPRFARKEIYRMLSEGMGYEYHTAEISNLQDARKVYRIIKKITFQH